MRKDCPMPGGLLDRIRGRIARFKLKAEDELNKPARGGRAHDDDELPESRMSESWPPMRSASWVNHLISAAADYQLQHGSVIKRPVLPAYVRQRQPEAYPVGASLVPTPFPTTLFSQAIELQSIWNELYFRVACDEEWLRETTAQVTAADAFVQVLWAIHDESKKARQLRLRDDYRFSVERVEMAIWRSDYMLHEDDQTGDLSLKQVEFNTISCAGGIHSNRISDMHRYFASIGLYGQSQEANADSPVTHNAMPTNTTLSSITASLASSHNHYVTHIAPTTHPRTDHPTKPQIYCILMPVQPYNMNPADERPIEYALNRLSPPIPCFRVEFGEAILASTRLTLEGKLFFTPPHLPHSPTHEVSVIYYRAGHDPNEYFLSESNFAANTTPNMYTDPAQRVPSMQSQGAKSRILLESSVAIQCPGVLGQIAGMKVVQCRLAERGMLEGFFSDTDTDIDEGREKVKKLRGTFVPMYPATSPAGQIILSNAVTNPKDGDIEDWILKPTHLEGGGHNIFGLSVPIFWAKVPERERGKYIIMRRMVPPPLSGILMGRRELYEGGVVCELQIFGSCLWKGYDGEPEVITSRNDTGWSFKTKEDNMDEMSVVKGFGCFDSPLLMSDDAFWLFVESARSNRRC